MCVNAILLGQQAVCTGCMLSIFISPHFLFLNSILYDFLLATAQKNLNFLQLQCCDVNNLECNMLFRTLELKLPLQNNEACN